MSFSERAFLLLFIDSVWRDTCLIVFWQFNEEKVINIREEVQTFFLRLLITLCTSLQKTNCPMDPGAWSNRRKKSIQTSISWSWTTWSTNSILLLLQFEATFRYWRFVFWKQGMYNCPVSHYSKAANNIPCWLGWFVACMTGVTSLWFLL